MMRPATVTLRVVKGRKEGTEHVFAERTTCVLGRAADCDPRLPDDEHHRTVSRHHCLLDINPPDARIRDFGSLNGTYVNGTKIGQRQAHQTPAEGMAESHPEHDLTDGDEIRIGETVFRVAIDAPARDGGTSRLARCARCGREVDDEVGERTGEYVCAACQSDPSAVLRVLLEVARNGRTDLAAISDYEPLRELGRGGMGAVHLARNRRTGEEVALKVMLPKVAASEEACARFLREIGLTRALRHQNIVSLRDAGFADGTFFFTLEYCPGGGLDGMVRRRGGRLPVEEAVPIFLQALDGLAHAHGQGVVHRDLSPSNILLSENEVGSPVAKVADFGLAKAFDQAGLSGLTRTGTAAGKPWYIPRQQVINFRAASPAVDTWALAACLYQVISGHRPREFPRGKDPWRVVLETPATPIRRHDPGIPRALAEVIDHALQERPAIGFQTAAELRDALSS
ncbi:hypothetical protein GCM10029978_099020 [Actinoallomurus acanthiterrae]